MLKHFLIAARIEQKTAFLAFSILVCAGFALLFRPAMVQAIGPPTVTIAMSDTALTIGETALVTFTFSEAPTGFTNADVDLSDANGTLSAVTAGGDPAVYTATFTPTASLQDATNVIRVGTDWTNGSGDHPNAVSAGLMTTYAGTGASPAGIAFDGINMWTSNLNNNSVTKITPAGAMTTYTGTGDSPFGIAFDGTNMWVTNQNGNSVTKITPAGAMTTYPGTGVRPYGIAFDGTNMWTANWSDNSVTKVAPDGTMTTYTGTGANPFGIAFDGTNMWTANYFGNSVTKITPAGAMTTYVGTGATPRGIAFDGTNMWTANESVDSVTKITPAGVMTTYTGTGDGPYAIAFDDTNMWTSNNNNNSVTKITPAGAMTTYVGTGATPLAIAFDDTNMWTANLVGNSVTRIGLIAAISANFTIDTTLSPTVTVVQPNGGETLSASQSYQIVWSSGGDGIASYRASWSSDGGASWSVIASGLAGNFYAWTVPNVNTTTARVRVEARDGSNATVASDDSNANFRIVIREASQAGYRWRNDDGTETTATAAAVENVPLSGISSDAVRRLRLSAKAENVSGDPTVEATAAAAANYLVASAIDSSQGFGYFSDWNTPSIVSKINLATMQVVGTLSVPFYSEGAMVIDTAAGFLYMGTAESPARVFRIALSTFTLVGTLNLPLGDDRLRSAVIDTSGATHYAYFGTWTSPGKVVKVNLSTFTRVDALTLAAGENLLRSAVIDPANGFAYFGTNTAPGKLVKIALSTFTRVGVASGISGEGAFRSADIDVADGYILVGTNNPGTIATPPHHVIKFTLSPFARASSLLIDPDTGNLTSLALDAGHDVVYVASSRWSSSADILYFDAASMTVSGSLTASTYGFYSGFFDPVSARAYFGEADGSASVYRIAPPDPSVAFRLEVAQKGSSCAASTGWTAVPTTGTSAGWQLFDTTWYADGDPSTNVLGMLSDPASTFVTGYLKDSTADTADVNFRSGTFTELEYALKYVGNGGSYCFRLTKAGDSGPILIDRYAEATGPSSGGGGPTPQPPTVTVVQPNGGETLQGNSSYQIVWSSGGNGIGSYRLSYSTDAGSAWNAVATGVTVNYYTWTVPNVSTASARVRVEAMNGAGAVVATDDSNGNFTIQPVSTGGGSAPPPTPPPTNPPRAHDYDPAAERDAVPTIDIDLGLTPSTNPKCTPGSLIRGTTSTVYYCAVDGQRYVFPNEKTFFTWFPDFAQVRFLTNAEVSAIPLASRYVPYRPGVKMLKLQTDPMVYVVARFAVLRAVPDEQTARDLYGMNWNAWIDDIPKAFWSGYTIGTPIK